MIYESAFDRRCQLVLDTFDGKIMQHHVEQDQFYSLLLSRRTLERCDDELSHRHGLFDPQSGDLFDIDDSDLLSQT